MCHISFFKCAVVMQCAEEPQPVTFTPYEAVYIHSACSGPGTTRKLLLLFYTYLGCYL